MSNKNDYENLEGGVSNFIGSNTTAVTKVQSVIGTTETTVFTLPVTGGILSTNKAINVQLNVSNVSGTGSATINIKYGGTTIGTALVSSVSSQFGTMNFVMNNLLIGNGATNAQKGSYYAVSGGNGFTFSPSPVYDYVKAGNTTSTIDSTTSQNITVTVQFAGSSVNWSATFDSILVESIA